jgi:hypothetical protein
MIKVLIDGHMLLKKEGGNTRYVKGIADYNLYPKGINVTVYKATTHSVITDVTRLLWGLNAKVTKVKADILHSTYFSPLIANTKTILTVHDFLCMRSPEIFNLKDRLLFKWYLPYCLKLEIKYSLHTKRQMKHLNR